MPQLDLYILSTQIFWLLLKFYFFYLILLRSHLLAILRLFKIRNKFFKLLISEKEQFQLQEETYNNFFNLIYK